MSKLCVGITWAREGRKLGGRNDGKQQVELSIMGRYEIHDDS